MLKTNILNYFCASLMRTNLDAPTDEKIEYWLQIGDIPSLEQVVLDGRGYLLVDKTSINLASTDFLEGLTQYQVKINEIKKNQI